MDVAKRTRRTWKPDLSQETPAKIDPDVNGEGENVEDTEVPKKNVEEDAPVTDAPIIEEKPTEGNPKETVEEKVEELVTDKNKSKKRKIAEEVKLSEESTTEENFVPDGKDAPIAEATSKPEKSEKDDSSANDSASELAMPPKQTFGKGKRARVPNKRYSDIPPVQSRPLKASVENGEKFDRFESESELEPTIGKDDDTASIPSVTSLKSRSNTSSPSGKRTKFVDITNPNFLKPFEHGWKRELVYRATNDTPNKRNGDVYYYTPTGKKVRSMREVAENLKNKELSMDDFTFFKEPLGLDDPEKEIIRDAKVAYKKTPLPKGTKTPKVMSPKVMSPKVATPRVVSSPKPAPTPKVVAPKVSSPKLPATPVIEKSPAASPRSRAASRNLGNIKVKLPPSKTKGTKRAKAEETSFEVEAPSPKRPANRKSVKASNNLEMDGKPCQPCSIRCQGVLGMIPTLQCRICLCLYHYECVGLSPHVQVEGYICKNCQLEHGQSVAASPSIALPPLTPINTLKSMTTQSTVLPKLQRIPRPNEHTPQQSPEHQQETVPATPPSLPRLLPLPTLQTTTDNVSVAQPKTACPAESKSLVGSVTSWLPHSSTIQVDNLRNKENQPVQAPRPQFVEFLGGRKFLIIPKHNVVSVSPTVNKPRYQQQVSKIATDETESPVNGHGIEEREEARQDGEGDGRVQRSGIIDEDPEPAEVVPKAKKRGAVKANNLSSEKVEEPKSGGSYLQNLSYGYNTLLCVFQYLKVQDLLRAGCVCTMWRDIASHSSLWRTVRMKNSQVHSFDGLSNTLKKHGTVHLDLRKMLLPTNGEDIWPEFSKAISKVDTLRKIELCRCPASVVEQLAVSNQNLEVINAVAIKSESISVDPLAALKNLKELRLKATAVITLSPDITALKELTNLTHLSLTSIKELNKMDLSVIAELTLLESLELGECADFPKNFNQILIKLMNLEKLRLEKGQGNCHTFEILEAVKNMPQLEQLELVNFDIKSGFDLALGGCSNIKKLLIIPTYISQSATTNHMVLGGVLRLQNTLSHFVWGVTLELLRVTELFVDQCEDPDKKNKKEKKLAGNGDSIPVLKPVPLITDKNDEIPPAHDPPQVEILPLPNLQKLLLQSLPTTRVKILKIPFHATWRQSITDTVN